MDLSDSLTGTTDRQGDIERNFLLLGINVNNFLQATHNDQKFDKNYSYLKSLSRHGFCTLQAS